jgi:hypothetical protein
MKYLGSLLAHSTRLTPGSAITGLPVPFYSQIDFFGNLSGRHSAVASCGGFQPAATPSLSACQTLTPPGDIYLIDYTYLDRGSQELFPTCYLKFKSEPFKAEK